MSRPTETRFARYLVDVPPGGLLIAGEDGIALDLDTARNQVVVRPPDAHPRDDALPVAPRDSTRLIVIAHSATRGDDARYVAAALRAVVAVLDRPLTITTVETDTLPQAADVLFWLHEKPSPAALTHRIETGLVLVHDAAGEGWQDVQRRVLMTPRSPGDPPVLKRRVAAVRRGQARWRDSAGEPLLERADTGAGMQYWFHSRFHPSAGALVRHVAFPEWIGALLEEGAPALSPGDRRRLSTAQRMPAQRDGPVLRESKPTATRLHQPLWVFLFGLFMLERWVAHRRLSG
jgi:hypothetical protein